MKAVVVMLMAAYCCVALAHTQQEELSVVREMILGVQRSWRDVVSMDDDTNAWRLIDMRYDDMFASFPTNHFGYSWTSQERKNAFENFIEAIPELSTNGLYRSVSLDGAVALRYCISHSHSNVLSAAIRILSSPSSECHSVAADVFVKFARPTSDINAFVADVVTNGARYSDLTRSDVLSGYAEVLRERRDGCQAEVVTNGVALVVGAVSGREGVVPVDRLLLDLYPNYECSSNRLNFAVFALEDTRHANYDDVLFHKYFDPITNQLLNASQPLVQLELPSCK